MRSVGCPKWSCRPSARSWVRTNVTSSRHRACKLGAFLVSGSPRPVASFGHRRLSHQQGQHRACFGFELRASTPSRRHPTSKPARSPARQIQRGHDRDCFFWSRPGSIAARRVGRDGSGRAGDVVALPSLSPEGSDRRPGCRVRGPVDASLRHPGWSPHRVPEDRDVVTMPVDHVSNQIDGEVLDWLDSLPGYSLNLGAGATTRRSSRSWSSSTPSSPTPAWSAMRTSSRSKTMSSTRW